MNNLGLRQAKQQIIGFINGLPFDIEVKRLLMKDIYDEVKDESDRTVLKEMAEATKALKEKENEDEAKQE